VLVFAVAHPGALIIPLRCQRLGPRRTSAPCRSLHPHGERSHRGPPAGRSDSQPTANLPHTRPETWHPTGTTPAARTTARWPPRASAFAHEESASLAKDGRCGRERGVRRRTIGSRAALPFVEKQHRALLGARSALESAGRQAAWRCAISRPLRRRAVNSTDDVRLPAAEPARRDSAPAQQARFAGALPPPPAPCGSP
jgi:hypothetical protein